MAKPKGLMELFKFACYVGIPISMMVVFANNPDNLEKIIRNVRFRSLIPFPY
jgi:hypothetical protein